MIKIEKSDTWQQHQLAAVERMQRDLARFTHPVIRGVGMCGVAYLTSWLVVMVLGAGGVSMAVVVVAGLSAAVVALGAPAFALTLAVEQYLRERLHGRRG
jgi:hypothetical protein